MLVTTVTYGRDPIFERASYAREAVECLYRVRTLHPFFLYGFVIMPDHCHFLMRVPADGSVSNVVGAYKSGLTFDLGIGAFWQRRFNIRLIDDLDGASRYIHFNPVRAGLVTQPEDYPWSSASRRWATEAFQ